MTYASVLQRTASLPKANPAMIGRFAVDGENIDFPVSESDIRRDTQWCADILRAYRIGAGDHILLSSHAWHCPWVDPIRSAATDVGAVYSNVEAWAWDVRRMASFLTRFRVEMLVGLGGESLTALEAVGDISDLLAGVKTILARPDTVGPLRDMGFESGVIAQIGPMLALSAPNGDGLIFNDDEWSVRSVDGEFVVSSGRQRAARFERQRTGVGGRVVVVHGRTMLEMDA